MSEWLYRQSNEKQDQIKADAAQRNQEALDSWENSQSAPEASEAASTVDSNVSNSSNLTDRSAEKN
jgi:hypothetical protein